MEYLLGIFFLYFVIPAVRRTHMANIERCINTMHVHTYEHFFRAESMEYNAQYMCAALPWVNYQAARHVA